MEKPDSEVVDRILSILDDRREMESAIKELRETANQLVSEITNESNKIEIAAYLYWLCPEIRPTDIAQAITGQTNVHGLLKLIHSVTTNITCDRCGTRIEFKSRTQLNEQIAKINKNLPTWAEGYRAICETCKSEVVAERHSKYLEEEKERNDRFSYLRSMPYKEYLQSPEWKERRARHLKSAGFRCQVCNSPKQPLDVHHRTYERRGQEYFKDLIVLCRDCHTTFHEAGKLADH